MNHPVDFACGDRVITDTKGFKTNSGKNFAVLVHEEDHAKLIKHDAEIVIEKQEDTGWTHSMSLPLKACRHRRPMRGTTSCTSWFEYKNSHFRVNVPVPAHDGKAQRVSFEVHKVKQWQSVEVQRKNSLHFKPGPGDVYCPICYQRVSGNNGLRRHAGKTECKAKLALREEKMSNTQPRSSNRYGPALTALFNSIESKKTEVPSGKARRHTARIESGKTEVSSGKAPRHTADKQQRRTMPYVLHH